MFVLCLVSSSLLASAAYFLKGPQEEAKQFDRSKQMLIAAGILTHAESFRLDGEPARYDEVRHLLVPTKASVRATDSAIAEVARYRIRPLLTNEQGELRTFESMNWVLSSYLHEHHTLGYAQLPWKLFYAVLPNRADAASLPAEALVEDSSLFTAVIIPVSGIGLWAPMYGYLAIGQNGDEVLGTTWYEMAETPGLGANITEAKWQSQFRGKLVFHESDKGSTDLQTADMGIIVVKGRVQDVYGTNPLSKSAVDGMSGATITGNGITDGFQKSLTPYRELLIRMHQEVR